MRLVATEAIINVLEAELDLVVENIEFEDEARCLYSLSKSRTANSNNREIALKVLSSQCKKVTKDDVAKETVVKSFKKLIDNGHAVKLSDLPQDDLRKML